jgi:hypothetical protein
MDAIEKLISHELRFCSADPYLEWLVRAIEEDVPDNWNNKDKYLKAALANAKAYLKAKKE